MTDDVLLRADELVKHFSTTGSRIFRRASATVHAVDGVSVSVRRGETLGVVGESGCGKSTLARMIARLIDPTAGTIELDGHDITSVGGRQLRGVRADVQMVFQDPFASLNPRHNVGTIIETPLRFVEGATEAERRERVDELMVLVGLNPEHRHRYPHEFSGGQRQRIGIARALAVRPKLVVADEPVSALDVSIQAQILNLLEQLRSDLGLSYVFIAHDLSVVRHIADEVVVMYLGKIVERGAPDAVYRSPAHPYTLALLSAAPVADPVAMRSRQRIVLQGDVPSPIAPPSGCRFRTRCPKATPMCAEHEPPLVERSAHHWVSCHFPE